MDNYRGMPRILALTVLSAMAAAAQPSDAERLPKFFPEGEPGFQHVCAQEELADLHVVYVRGGKLDIDVGERKDGVIIPILFTKEQLSSFFQKQGRGKYVLVMIESLAFHSLSKQDREALIESLSEYLLSCGVRRVRIHLAVATGRYVLYDRTRDTK